MNCSPLINQRSYLKNNLHIIFATTAQIGWGQNQNQINTLLELEWKDFKLHLIMNPTSYKFFQSDTINNHEQPISRYVYTYA